MHQVQHEISVKTRGKGLHEVTPEIANWVAGQDMDSGLIVVFIRHTSASLIVQENADPDVLLDLETFFQQLVPQDRGSYRHGAEGPDDMPAHIRAALMQTQLSIPIVAGRLGLGTWQGIYVYEHRDAPHTRHLLLQLIGE